MRGEKFVNLVMNRRGVLSGLGKCISLFAFFPYFNKMRNTPSNDFIVVDGWVLRVDDIRGKR